MLEVLIKLFSATGEIEEGEFTKGVFNAQNE